HRRPDGPLGEQDVVDQDDGGTGDVEVDPGLVDLGSLGPHPDVVAIERDVQGAHGDLDPLDAPDLDGQAPGQVVPPGGDPRQHQPTGALVPLDDLVGDPGDGPADLAGVHQPAPLDEGGHSPPRSTGRAGEIQTPRAWRGASPSVKPRLSFPASRDRTYRGR